MPKVRGAAMSRAAVAVVVLVAALAGCGSGPTAEAWAGQVCDALSPWRAQITTLNTSTQQQMSTATTPAQAQAGLLRLLAGGQSASETARAAVVAAGTPDVDGGDEVARQFAASLAKVRDAYAHAHADLAALSSSDGAFYDRVAAVLATLTDEYGRTGVDTSKLNSVELRNAFDKVDRCQ